MLVFITFGLIPGTIGYRPRNPLLLLLLLLPPDPPDDDDVVVAGPPPLFDVDLEVVVDVVLLSQLYKKAFTHCKTLRQ